MFASSDGVVVVADGTCRADDQALARAVAASSIADLTLSVKSTAGYKEPRYLFLDNMNSDEKRSLSPVRIPVRKTGESTKGGQRSELSGAVSQIKFDHDYSLNCTCAVREVKHLGADSVVRLVVEFKFPRISKEQCVC